jgi:hypothetical protein
MCNEQGGWLKLAAGLVGKLLESGRSATATKGAGAAQKKGDIFARCRPWGGVFGIGPVGRILG